MPASRIRRRAVLLAGSAAAAWSAAAPAHAATADPCSLLWGSMKSACESTNTLLNGGGGGGGAISWASDPAGALAQVAMSSALWMLNRATDALGGSPQYSTTRVDFTDPGFLGVYAVVFGAATVLTVILWLVAVTKRALRGAGLVASMSEAVGGLWLSVIASAFTPLALYYLMALVDAATTAIAGTSATSPSGALGTLSAAMAKADTANPGVTILMALLLMVASCLIWLEMLLRAAALYVGGVLGALSASALVDRDLWQHYRRWIGLISVMALAKPILYIVLDLAGALMGDGGITVSSSDPLSAMFVGSALLYMAAFASWTVYRWVPVFGDDLATAAANRRDAANAGPAAAFDGPSTHVRSAIHTAVSEQVITRSRGLGKFAPNGSGSGSGAGGGGAGAGASAESAPIAPTGNGNGGGGANGSGVAPRGDGRPIAQGGSGGHAKDPALVAADEERLAGRGPNIARGMGAASGPDRPQGGTGFAPAGPVTSSPPPPGAPPPRPRTGGEGS